MYYKVQNQVNSEPKNNPSPPPPTYVLVNSSSSYVFCFFGKVMIRIHLCSNKLQLIDTMERAKNTRALLCYLHSFFIWIQVPKIITRYLIFKWLLWLLYCQKIVFWHPLQALLPKQPNSIQIASIRGHLKTNCKISGSSEASGNSEKTLISRQNLENRSINVRRCRALTHS